MPAHNIPKIVIQGIFDALTVPATPEIALETFLDILETDDTDDIPAQNAKVLTMALFGILNFQNFAYALLRQVFLARDELRLQLVDRERINPLTNQVLVAHPVIKENIRNIQNHVKRNEEAIAARIAGLPETVTLISEDRADAPPPPPAQPAAQPDRPAAAATIRRPANATHGGRRPETGDNTNSRVQAPPAPFTYDAPIGLFDLLNIATTGAIGFLFSMVGEKMEEDNTGFNVFSYMYRVFVGLLLMPFLLLLKFFQLFNAPNQYPTVGVQALKVTAYAAKAFYGLSLAIGSLLLIVFCCLMWAAGLILLAIAVVVALVILLIALVLVAIALVSGLCTAIVFFFTGDRDPFAILRQTAAICVKVLLGILCGITDSLKML